MMEYILHGRFPSKVERVDEPENVRALIHEWNAVQLENSILTCTNGVYSQLVISRKLDQIISKCDTFGERVLQLAGGQFYWPRILEGITHYVKKYATV